VISINANSLTDEFRPDGGRSTGPIGIVPGTESNYGPLVRNNRISSLVDTTQNTAGEFNIEVIYDPSLPRRVRTAVEAAVAKWESVIVGDLTPAVDPTTGRQIDDIPRQCPGQCRPQAVQAGHGCKPLSALRRRSRCRHE